MVVDIPKDIQFAKGVYSKPNDFQHTGYKPKLKGDMDKIKPAVELMAHAKRPLFYTGGGVINSGQEASELLRELVKLTGFPDHLDADGARRVSRPPIRNGSACSACTAPTKPTWRCTIAT